jgi:hypothetical protein
MSVEGGPDIVTDGLVLHLDAANNRSFVSGSNTWFDLSRNNNTASLINGPTYNSGNGGNIVFDGSNDYVEITSTGSLQINTNQVTVMSVVKVTGFAENRARLIDTANTSTVGPIGQYTLKIGTGSPFQNVSWFIGGSDGVGREVRRSTSVITSTDIPYVIMARWRQSDGAASIFVNGVETPYSVTATYSGTLATLVNPFTIGFLRGFNLYGNQIIYLTSVYNRYLSDKEIRQNYNATKGRFGLF